ncbi:YHS domain-containing (seleno)protein [uncultured Roseibium sp.]|uniref:YHS domain-containing (seleno)protein n=1 Tax=uncultured Roseibium sp. TaxID=1936171 RepID=UPI0026174CED|nr:YHS domain-containing (seleno)protein [uncultured Roseibium sp.]
MSFSKTLVAVTLLGIANLSGPALAADEYNTSSGLTAAGAPLGMHGVDPVAFVNLGNRIDGAARHTALHDGVAYYFSSKETMDKFTADPAAYLPQNGGFCTFGVSVGKKFDGDPQFAAIVDDKLYLFLNEEIFRAFLKDEAGTIAKAEENWVKIRSTAAKDL